VCAATALRYFRRVAQLWLLERMKEVAARPITPQEAEVLDLALRRGALISVPESMLANVASLQMIGVCPCGCRSIYFAPESRKDVRLADTIGRTADGKQIDVMVWGAEGRLSALDLVDYFGTGELPTAESIGQYGHLILGSAFVERAACAINCRRGYMGRRNANQKHQPM
jgi:hypothetical protein